MLSHGTLLHCVEHSTPRHWAEHAKCGTSSSLKQSATSCQTQHSHSTPLSCVEHNPLQHPDE